MHCKKFFVETINTPMYHRHISEEDLILVGKLLVEKMGNRPISRVTGFALETVARIIDAIILHAAEFNALMAGKAKVGPVELDEMWTFVKKNKRTLTLKQETQISKAMHGSIPESSEIQSL